MDSWMAATPGADPCPEGGNHYWHAEGPLLLSYPPKRKFVCSECNETKVTTASGESELSDAEKRKT